MVTVKTAAKLNLLLNITGVMDDGYHALETVMQTVDLYDFISIEAGGGGIALSGNLPYIPYNEKNLVYRAADAFFRAASIEPRVRIGLIKHIPVQAGMGGGSGNAAGTLIGLNRMFGRPLSNGQLLSLAAPLGADVPYFLAGGTALCTGRGDRLSPLHAMPDCAFVVLKGRQGVSTLAAYAGYDADPVARTGDIRRLLVGLDRGDLAEVCAGLGNDFYAYASSQCPQIEQARDQLLRHGALGACMTGSGSAVFGIFPDLPAARRCAEQLGGKYAYAAVARPTDGSVVVFENG